MPTIRYTRQVRPTPVTGARLGAPAELTDIAPAAGILAGAEQRARDHADQIALDGVELGLSNAQTALMAGVADAKGVNALKAASDAQQEWHTQSSELIGSLPEHLQERAQRRANNYWSQLYANSESHAHSETRKADDANTTALLDRQVNAVDADPFSAPARIEESRARIADFGRRDGWTPEVIAKRQERQAALIHATALTRLLTDERFGEAQGYFNEHGDELTPDAKARTERLITKGVSQHEGEQAARDILKLDDQGQTALPESAALEQVAKIADDDQRDAARKIIDSHYTKTEHAQRLDRQAAKARLLTQLERSGGRLNKGDPDYALIEGHPEGEEVLHRQTQILRPPPDKGDPALYTKSLSEASLPGTRAEFLTKVFTGDDGKGLNDTQRNHLINLQRHYRDAGKPRTKKGAVAPLHLLETASPFAQFQHDAPVPTRNATAEEIIAARKDPEYADHLRMFGVKLP